MRLHNFGIADSQMNVMSAMLAVDIAAARADPLNFTLFVGGDMNFLAPGDAPQSLKSPCSTAAPMCPTQGHQQREWQSLLGKPTELEQPELTHYVPDSMTCSNCSASARVVWPPRQTHDEKLSDPALMIVQLSTRRQLDPDVQPILKSVFEDPHFPVIHDRLCR